MCVRLAANAARLNRIFEDWSGFGNASLGQGHDRTIHPKLNYLSVGYQCWDVIRAKCTHIGAVLCYNHYSLKILPINPWRSRFWREIYFLAFCFQDFAPDRGKGGTHSTAMRVPNMGIAVSDNLEVTYSLPHRVKLSRLLALASLRPANSRTQEDYQRTRPYFHQL